MRRLIVSVLAVASCLVATSVYVAVSLLARSSCEYQSSFAFSRVVASCLGVPASRREYEGAIILHSLLQVPAGLSFFSPQTPRIEIASARLESGVEHSFDAGRSNNFDFLLRVQAPVGHAVLETWQTVVRGGSYRLVVSESTSSATPELLVEEIAAPVRQRTDMLIDTPGLSFSFSASGWLFVYQLGVAECLQAHGINRSHHVRVAGASGGAVTAWTMMYGADMRFLRDQIREKAKTVHGKFSQALNLRSFLLDVMKQVLRDCSFRHPAFHSGRVEIALSERPAGTFLGGVKSRRIKYFNESSEIAIALLGSSTLGISGLPFTWTNEQGQYVQIADGAFTDFMPEVDEFSVKVKPFSDGLNLFGKSVPDVTPTEFVPLGYGFWPPDPTGLDHLYELGYRDMEAWLQEHLQQRLAKIRTSASPDVSLKPSVGMVTSESSRTAQFSCSHAENGTEWYPKVRQIVPVAWQEQLFSGPASR